MEWAAIARTTYLRRWSQLLGEGAEQELKRDPHDLDKKADVGSDESMDASDPPAASQPGQTDDPVPSSGFPE
jgi:hypothetical protein